MVVGGSIGGLTAALVLRDIGFDVKVFERTPRTLLGRGGGIVLQPDTTRWFTERSGQDLDSVSTSTSQVQYIDRGMGIVHSEQRGWRHTAWGTFYQALLNDFGLERYHLNSRAIGLLNDPSGQSAGVKFVDGSIETADLVVFADGVGSVARPIFDPNPLSQYSGYVAWRGTVPLLDLSAETRGVLDDAMTYNLLPHSHVMIYPIPSEKGVKPEERLMNFMWYRNVDEGAELADLLTGKDGNSAFLTVPPGQVRDEFVVEMRNAASALLASPASEVILAAEDPYLQVIKDFRSSRIRLGRAALIGDAACTARPHAAAGTAKAAADAWALQDALLAADGRIDDALTVWEPGQLELSKALLERSTGMGERAQLHNNWVPGDPSLKFGLYGSGLTHPTAHSD